MIKSGWLVALASSSLFAVALVPLACGSSAGQAGDTPLDGSAGSDGAPGTLPDGGASSGGDGAACGATGGACGQGSDCCSNLCMGNTCVATIGACAAAGGTCTVGTDCCGGACVGGACSAAQCVTVGAPCPASGNHCCTDTCVNGACAVIGGGDGGTASCTTAGNACTSSAACCSGLCAGGTCQIASSYCTQPNDICFHAADCCGGVCNSPNASPVSATNPGTCGSPPAVGGVNCSGIDGTLCDPTRLGCAGGCCSHLCAPFGPTGVAICQQAQGCHVEGDLCRQNADCCGGESADAGILGAGLVVCTIPTGSTIGYCTTPNGSNGGGNTCVPEGDVCHYTGNTGDAGYSCSSSSARSDCCGDQTPKFLACQLDKLGVPRCLAYGLSDGGTDACRQTGSTCATAADCCNGQPCVPDATGQLTCVATACVASSGSCTSTADCCAGVTCVVPVGSTQGTCAPLAPPPTGGGSDGGGSSGGTGGDSGAGLGCAEIGQSCAALGCCANLECLGETCSIPIK